LPATLASLADADPQRAIAVCRELTKRFEEVSRGTAAALAVRFAVPPRGEITLVIGPAEGVPRQAEANVAAAWAMAELLTEKVSRRRAAQIVSRLTGVGANRLYRDSL
jgi:16S rRNA (cytidine1402-2'-O)-methyltransferase